MRVSGSRTGYYTNPIGPMGGADLSTGVTPTIVVSPFDSSGISLFSVHLENNQSGGGHTATFKVWSSNVASPGTPSHTGAEDWAQLGDDITLAAGDRKTYQWTTPSRRVCVTAGATATITSELAARVVGLA